ncbi:MAG TPA: zf-HC2 domain-containing protein [Actinocrinis sp.]|nr:zf-HC2 domain-containing protein [Actinocrinis sp.]
MSDRVPPCTAARDPWLREAVGAYLLGALEPEENDRVAAHLVTCESCRAEYGELTELLPLLASVTETEAVNGPVRPEPAVLGRVLESASQQVAVDVHHTARPSLLDPLDHPEHATQHRGRGYRPARTSLRTRIALGAAGLVAAAGAGIGVLLAGGAQVAAAPGSWSASTTVAASAGGYDEPINASVEVTSVSWGSKIQLKMDHVPAGYTCTMVVVSTSGTPVVAGDWKASSEETFTIPGSVSLTPDRIATIQVDLPNGSTLLSLNHPH